jgi:uncharacterized RDD family membrane protein YckC
MQENGSSRANLPDLLREEYTIDTPENVTFGYTIAGIGSRFIGALVDTGLLVLALLLLNIAISLLLAWLADSAPPQPIDAEPTPDWIAGLLIAVYALINFGIIWGYYLAFELLWNGQTPGKRLSNTQVVRENGAPAEFAEVAIRNVVRIIDFLPFAYALGFVVMFSNRRSRRLGDFAANTLVIKRQDSVKLSDLGAGTPVPPAKSPVPASGEMLALYPNLAQIGEDEYQLVRDVLARHTAGTAGSDLLQRLAVAMAARVGARAPALDQHSCRLFLTGLADAYQAMGGQAASDSKP